jgi:hypothetical protein
MRLNFSQPLGKTIKSIEERGGIGKVLSQGDVGLSLFNQSSAYDLISHHVGAVIHSGQYV